MKRVEDWKEEVKKKHPQIASKLKFLSKDGGKHISAEIPGEDRCYGVFDVNKGSGEVLGESVTKHGKLKTNYSYGSEKFDAGRSVEIVGEEGDEYLIKPFPIMADKKKPLRFKKTDIVVESDQHSILKSYLEALEPSNFDVEADMLTEGFLDWFKKNENEGRVKVYRLTPADVKKAMSGEDTKGIDFSIKNDIYAIANESPIIDELITMLGLPRDGTPYRIRTGYMTYVQRQKLLVFARNKYDLPGFIGRRPK